MLPAELIRPNDAAPNDAPGLPKLTVLKVLKISARISNRTVAPSGTLFIIDRSVLTNLGPRSRLREAFPNVNGAGSANAPASKQLISSREVGLGWQLSEGTAPTRSGRCWPVMPIFARSVPNVTLTGEPLCIVVTPPICHPATTYRTSGCDELLKNGIS